MDQNNDSSGFDQIQSLQYPVIHHPSQKTSEEILQAKENLMESIQTFLQKFSRYPFGVMPNVLSQAWERFSEIKHAFTNKQYQPEDIKELFQELLEDVRNIIKEVAEYINSPSWNYPIFYDDDEEHYVQYKEYLENSSNAITTVLPTKEPEYSLIFTNFSNPLFDYNDDFTSSDDESFFNEDVPMENFKIYSNRLFDDKEIISTKIDPHYFNVESNLIESLLNRDTLIDSSPKFDFLLKEFSGELAHINLFLSGIEEADFELEEEIRLDDPSFPRLPPEPSDVEFFFDSEPELLSAVKNNIDELNEDECLDPGGGWKGDVIITGDFNEVRTAGERFGSINVRGAAAFKSFVSSGGYSYTWAYKSATKMSKLDRFFIYEDLMRNCPNISSITLDRFLSDHRPILLREIRLDYASRLFFHALGLRINHQKCGLMGIAVETNKVDNVANNLGYGYGRFQEMGEFFVSSVRNLIDDKTLGMVGSKTQWCKFVSIKVNIHSWRFKLNNLPTRLNLSRRGMELHSIFCPSCSLAVESTNHIFFSCFMMKDLYKAIAGWWDVKVLEVSTYED
nr:RNA-directed DNA polymerase, eukaryota [Tanacetum cinerariifolium]